MEWLGSRGVTPIGGTAATAAEPKPVPEAVLAMGRQRAGRCIADQPSRRHRSAGTDWSQPGVRPRRRDLEARKHRQRTQDPLDLRTVSSAGGMTREPPEIVRVALGELFDALPGVVAKIDQPRIERPLGGDVASRSDGKVRVAFDFEASTLVWKVAHLPLLCPDPHPRKWCQDGRAG